MRQSAIGVAVFCSAIALTSCSGPSGSEAVASARAADSPVIFSQHLTGRAANANWIGGNECGFGYVGVSVTEMSGGYVQVVFDVEDLCTTPPTNFFAAAEVPRSVQINGSLKSFDFTDVIQVCDDVLGCASLAVDLHWSANGGFISNTSHGTSMIMDQQGVARLHVVDSMEGTLRTSNVSGSLVLDFAGGIDLTFGTAPISADIENDHSHTVVITKP
jgi:hypothetical protein